MAERSRNHILVADGEWFAGSILTNPADQALIADTGALSEGNYLVGVHGTGSVTWVYDIQHRNAANAANINSQRRRPAAGDSDFIFPNKFAVQTGERIRLILQGAVTGEIQQSIFVQEVR